MTKRDRSDASQRLTITPRESTRITGIGLNATYALLKSGEMPAIHTGKRYYIPRAALVRWLETVGAKTA
jgi:excisionase family DNA binding protein